MKTKDPVQVEWIKHVIAANENGDPKDIIENVSLSAADGIRGDLTGKEYDMVGALAMTTKYDRLAAAGYLREEPHINKLSATDAVIAAKTGKDAAAYHKQNPKLIKKWKELRKKRNKILEDIKKEKQIEKLVDLPIINRKIVPDNINYQKMPNQDLKSNMRKWIQEADDSKKKEKLSKQDEYNILFNKKSDKYYNKNKSKPKKVASANNPKDANGYDHYPNVIPIGPIPHEKPWWQEDDLKPDDESYRFRFPKEERYTVLDKIKLRADLEKAVDADSGIGRFDNRRRLAGGGNGSTSDLDSQRPFTKRIEEIYNIQLSGNETLGELLEIIRKLDEQK